MNTVREIFNVHIPELADIPTAEKPCLLCGRREFFPLNTFVLNEQRFYTVRCKLDGMMWLEPQPTEEFYTWLYGALYHHAGPGDPLLEQATLDVHSRADDLKRIAQIRLDEIEQFSRKGSLLEVGFGSGAVLVLAKQRGWQVVGLGIEHGCVDQINAKGIQAHKSSILDYGGGIGTFDVVAMYSVIEHALDPIAYLNAAYRLLKPGGLLVLRLPDTEAEGPIASLIAHVYHFDAHTIMVLLRRCSFEILQISDFAVWKPKRYPSELWNMNVISRKGSTTG
jgi:SAM-dependent methyltransferase